MGVPVPSGPLLLPAGCSAELSQWLQTFPLLPLLLGHQLSSAEEESPHQEGGKTRRALLSEEKQLSPLGLLTHTLVSGHLMEAQEPATSKEITALSCCRLTALSWC